MNDAGPRPRRFVFGSPVNVRAELAPPVDDGLGFFVSMVAFDDVVAPDAPFWDVARAIKRDLEQRRARGEAATVIAALPGLLDVVGGGARAAPRDVALRFERRIPTTAGLTNLGRVDVATRHGPFTIERAGFVANPSALGDFVVTAATIEGGLSWNFVWPEPRLHRAHAEAVVDDVVARAIRAADVV
jgi:hypothetical protein